MVVVAGSSWQEERRVKGEERVFAWLPPSSFMERLGVRQAPVIIATWLLCLNNRRHRKLWLTPSRAAHIVSSLFLQVLRYPVDHGFQRISMFSSIV